MSWCFGVIADLQYADLPTGTGFSAKDTRYFRDSLSKASAARLAFASAGCSAVLQLGDLIDGRTVGPPGYSPYSPAGSVSAEQRAAAAAALAAVLSQLNGGGAGGGAAALAPPPLPIAHLRGNHENYAGVEALLPLPPGAAPCAPGSFAYTFSPRAGWRFVCLDPYEVSLAAPAGSAGRAEAERLLRAHNHNLVDLSGATKVEFFKGVAGAARRFVPFNGGLGAAQLAWLRAGLAAARAAGERVLLSCHIPLLPAGVRSQRVAGGEWLTFEALEDDKNDCLVFDYEEALAAVAEHADVVAAVFSGHDHEGSFGLDGAGVPHVCFPSPLTHNEVAHAVVVVHGDRLEVRGEGAVMPRELRPKCLST
jgi:manganese-dependent ADP-ribose/CDP-alcohol diphosphatase